VPWMLGGYMLVANETLCTQKGISLPEDVPSLINSLQAFKGSKKATALSVLQREGAQRNLPQGVLQVLPNGTGSRDAFHKGDVPFLMGDVRDLALLEQAGFTWQTIPLAHEIYVDEVNYLALMGRGDVLRQEMAYQLLAFLVSVPIQEQIDKAGGLSPLALRIYDEEPFMALENYMRGELMLLGAFGQEVTIPALPMVDETLPVG